MSYLTQINTFTTATTIYAGPHNQNFSGFEEGITNGLYDLSCSSVANSGGCMGAGFDGSVPGTLSVSETLGGTKVYEMFGMDGMKYTPIDGVPFIGILGTDTHKNMVGTEYGVPQIPMTRSGSVTGYGLYVYRASGTTICTTRMYIRFNTPGGSIAISPYTVSSNQSFMQYSVITRGVCSFSPGTRMYVHCYAGSGTVGSLVSAGGTTSLYLELTYD